jgi:malate dehydrogenase
VTFSPSPLNLEYDVRPHFQSITNEKQPNGAEKATNVLSGLNDGEKVLLKAAVEGLKGNIEKGVVFATKPAPAK